MLKARATEQLVFPISSSSPPTATRIEQTLGAGRMVQQLKDLAALPEDSGLSPNAYISTLVPGHLIPSLALSGTAYTWHILCKQANTRTHEVNFLKEKTDPVELYPGCF